MSSTPYPYVFSPNRSFSTIPKLGPHGWSKLEAATHFLFILLGGSLIPIVVYRDGDGFTFIEHAPPSVTQGRDALATRLILLSDSDAPGVGIQPLDLRQSNDVVGAGGQHFLIVFDHADRLEEVIAR